MSQGKLERREMAAVEESKAKKDLLSHRLNVVTGKGGVGKSTLSAALALVGQSQGKRVLVCEVTAKERVPALLGAPPTGTEITQIDRSIWSVHIKPEEAMREYGLMVLRYKAVYQAVFENRFMRYFLRALPSLAEIVMLGKTFWHVMEEVDEHGDPRWDLVILDAPATGHGISFLRTPKTILELVDEGPMLRDMRKMGAMLDDPTITAVNIVALPEEMPVNEAGDLYRALVDDVGLPQTGRVFLNGSFERRFSPEEAALIAATQSPELAPAREAAQFWTERQQLAEHYESRLREVVDLPLVRVPWLASESFGREAVETIARIISEEL